MTRISEALANFILNAGWQIAIILSIAAVGSYFLKNAFAKHRHVLWLGTLLLSLLAPLAIMIPTSPRLAPALIKTETPVMGVGAAAETPAAGAASDDPKTFDYLLTRRRQPITTSTRWLFLLSLGYGVFVFFRMVRLFRLWRRKETLRQGIVSNPLNRDVTAIAGRCSAAFGLEPISLACTSATKVPLTLGARKPVILLPEHLCKNFEPETLTSIIAHEMAHVARRDFAVNFIVELVSLPISFHPLTYLIKRQLSRARELACDELVTQHLLAPDAYARSLVRVANATVQIPAEALGLSIFDGNILEERVMRLTKKQRRLGSRSSRAITTIALGALAVAVLLPSGFSFNVQTHAGLPLTQQSDPPAQPIAKSSNDTPQPRPVQAPDSPKAQEQAQAACAAERERALDTIPTLIAMLRDDRETELLRCWDNGRWSPALETFKHPSPGEQAALALASMGPPAFKRLANELVNSNAVARRNAAWAIGELTGMPPGARSDVVPGLIILLNDSDVWVRMAAARALGELRDERATERLIMALADSEWRLRQLAAWALSEMKDTRAVSALCRVLLSDTQADVRRMAAEALGEIKSAEALPSLKQALNDPEPRVRAKAGWAISEIEDSD
jgi:beta-lactamase regulating signal transducer with metallopeptidase domain/HEAT repeat protein